MGRARSFFTPLAAAAVLVLAACAAPQTTKHAVSDGELAAEQAKQREVVLTERRRKLQRVLDVGYPILREGAALCGDAVAGDLGLKLATAGTWRNEWSDAARGAFDLDDHPRAFIVVRSSPAALAGIKPGDRIVAVGDHTVGAGSAGIEALHDFLDARIAAGADSFDVRIEQDGMDRELTLHPVTVCDYAIDVTDETALNATADGQTMRFSAGLLRFTSDEELAVVIGHELAHNAMAHIDAQEQNAMAAGAGGLMLDLLFALGGVNTGGAFMSEAANAGRLAYSQDFETEADYVGLYFVARAGYQVDEAAYFWRRMAAENPAAIEYASSHPTAPERFLRIEKTVEEIEAKRAAGQPLVPDRAAPGERSESETAAADYPE
jgi:hypothetical protein